MATESRREYVKNNLAYSYLKESATYLLDEVTTAVVMNHLKTKGNTIDDFAGNVVAITGNKEVGFGNNGNIIEGFIIKISPATVNDNDLFTVTVGFNQVMDKIPYSGLEPGELFSQYNNLFCDGAGKVTYNEGTPGGLRTVAIDEDTQTCTVRFI